MFPFSFKCTVQQLQLNICTKEKGGPMTELQKKKLFDSLFLRSRSSFFQTRPHDLTEL